MTYHMTVSLSFFERLNDKELENTFKREDETGLTALQIRTEIKRLKKKGFTVFPCPCKRHNPNGTCKGIKSFKKDSKKALESINGVDIKI